jgi:hypothetical protein
VVGPQASIEVAPGGVKITNETYAVLYAVVEQDFDGTIRVLDWRYS